MPSNSDVDVDVDFAASRALAADLSVRAAGLLCSPLGSEGDAPLEGIWLPAPACAELTAAAVAEAVAAAAGAGGAVAEILKTSDGLSVLTGLAEGYAGAAEHARAEGLRDEMVRHLVALIAVVLRGTGGEHPLYVVGRAADGAIVGVRSVVVWT